MATKRQGKSSDSPFQQAFEQWESEHPDAWNELVQEAKTTKPARTENPSDLALQLRAKIEKTKTQTQAPNATLSTSKSGAFASKPAATSSNKKRMHAEEVMKEAFDALLHQHDPTEKFTGGGYTLSDDVEIVEESLVLERVRQHLEHSDDPHASADAEFFQQMMDGDVSPIDQGARALRDAFDDNSRWSRSAVPRAFVQELRSEELSFPDLSREQKKILKLAGRQTNVPTLNIRHYRRREALSALIDFVLEAYANHDRFVRVITGKGKQSETDPVLKPMVLDWCQMEPGNRYVLGYAPEVDYTGTYGGLILELRATALPAT